MIFVYGCLVQVHRRYHPSTSCTTAHAKCHRASEIHLHLDYTYKNLLVTVQSKKVIRINSFKVINYFEHPWVEGRTKLQNLRNGSVVPVLMVYEYEPSPCRWEVIYQLWREENGLTASD